MESLIQLISSLISPQAILDLDWIVKGPGLAVIAWHLFRVVTSMFSFRIFRAMWAVIYAIAFAVILSQFGSGIQELVKPTEPKEKPVESYNQHVPDYRHQSFT